MKISEISREWLMKQKITLTGKDKLYTYLYGRHYPGKIGKAIISLDNSFINALGKRIIDFIYQIPEYEKYRGISEGFLTTHKSSNGIAPFYIALSPLNFDPEHDYTLSEYGEIPKYVNEESGQSWGGRRRIPQAILKGVYKRFENIDTHLQIDLSLYLGRGRSMPKNWSEELIQISSKGYNINKLPLEVEATNKYFLSKLTFEQRMEIKELFINYLDHVWEQTNKPLQYNFGRRDKNEWGKYYFLAHVSTIIELESDYPELVDKYVEANIDDLGTRYVNSLKGKAKDAYLGLKLKEKIDEIKDVLGYF